MSTAVERIMRERGDLTCFHEPFMYDYYLNRSPRMMPKFDPIPDQRRSYSETWEMVFEAAEAGPVFFKDMSYYHLPQLYDDPERSNRLINIFLIRDPRRVLASYDQKRRAPELSDIGIEQQAEQSSVAAGRSLRRSDQRSQSARFFPPVVRER